MPKFSACGELFYLKIGFLFDFGCKNAARRAAKIFRGQNPIYGQNQNNNTVVCPAESPERPLGAEGM